MARIISYKELRVYQAAMDAAMRIFHCRSDFLPKRDTLLRIKFDGHHDPLL